MHALREDLERNIAERPSGIGVLVLVAESAASSCVAVEGSGFRAAAIRSVLAGISFLVRPAYPHRVTDALVDGADWLTGVCGTTLARGFAVAELRHALTQVRNVRFAATG